jgi:hypothetical protein
VRAQVEKSLPTKGQALSSKPSHEKQQQQQKPKELP